MFFEMLNFLGWGWLIFFHIVAFGLLYLPFVFGLYSNFLQETRKRLDPSAETD